MNIFLLLIFISYMDIPQIPVDKRRSRHAATQRSCVRRRNTARFVVKNVENKVLNPYEPYWDKEDPNGNNYYKRVVKPFSNKVSHKWDTFYFKTRSIIDNGRVHAGDKHRKGKRPYNKENIDKIREHQMILDYIQYGE